MIKKFQAAFTILELCVVLGIIAILSSIFWSNYAGSKQARNLQQAKLQYAILSTALENYYFENRIYPDELSKLVDTQGHAYLDPIEAGFGMGAFKDPWGYNWMYTLNINTDTQGYYLMSVGLSECAVDNLTPTFATHF